MLHSFVAITLVEQLKSLQAAQEGHLKTSGQTPEVTVINGAKQFCLPGSLPCSAMASAQEGDGGRLSRKPLTKCFKASSL